MIHHIAIGTENPKVLGDFYQKIPGCTFLSEHRLDSGEIRSLWLQWGDLILMIELGKKEAPKALVFGIPSETQKREWKAFLKTVTITNKTDFTLYFKDPEDNQLGLSTYPKNIFSILESS